MMIIGKNIKELRESSGLTQKNIAKYLNVDQSLISKFEKGERQITMEMLAKIATLYGVMPEVLMEQSSPIKHQITFALRANEISQTELETISTINKIALNLKNMQNIAGGRKDA